MFKKKIKAVYCAGTSNISTNKMIFAKTALLMATATVIIFKTVKRDFMPPKVNKTTLALHFRITKFLSKVKLYNVRFDILFITLVFQYVYVNKAMSKNLQVNA